MITYNDLYEALRKERYSEQLQPLIKDFVKEVSNYVKDKKKTVSEETDLFSPNTQKSKKQLENAIAIFKELMLRRKRKILDLSFVSTETGVSKRDFENMLPFEKEMFEKIIKALNDSDKEMEKSLHSGDTDELSEKNKLIIFKENTEEFLDLEGNKIGPFKSGDIVNLPGEIANILIVDNKADAVEED